LFGLLILALVFYNLFRDELIKNQHSFSTVGKQGEFDDIVDVIYINTTNPEESKLFRFNRDTKELNEIKAVVMVNNLPETS
jgi:hypothetical protein